MRAACLSPFEGNINIVAHQCKVPFVKYTKQIKVAFIKGLFPMSMDAFIANVIN